jgi:hypothetical protein
MKAQLRLPAVLAVAVLSAAGTTLAVSSCGSGDPKPPDARQADAAPDADDCFGAYCVPDGTGSGTCPLCADFGTCPDGCVLT